MAANEFLLRIVGPDVSAASVEINDLARLLYGINGVVSSIAEAGGAKADEVHLGLVGVSDKLPNCDTLTLAGTPKSVESTGILIKALSSSRQDQLPKRARIHLRNIWDSVFENGWDACEVSGNGSHIGHASIQRANELFPAKGTCRGETVIYGECTRVGGEGQYRSARFRLIDGTSLTVRLRYKSVAQELGERLYNQTVGLAGEAIWKVATHEILQFRADALTPFTDRDDKASEPRTVAEAFKALSQAAGNRWDHIDPDTFVREQRSD